MEHGGQGPTVVYYPAGRPQALPRYGSCRSRRLAIAEVYADWLERKLAPRLAEHAKGQGLDGKVMCVDQQPIQVMRQRRREIERATHA